MKYHDPLHVPYQDLVVEYSGRVIYMMNKDLLDCQNCWENLDEIKETHWLKLVIYEMMHETNDSQKLKELTKDLTEIEFHLQELWKFSKDARFHRFWEYPKCKCPSQDNQDAYPFRQYINLSCALHGDNQ